SSRARLGRGGTPAGRGECFPWHQSARRADNSRRQARGDAAASFQRRCRLPWADPDRQYAGLVLALLRRVRLWHGFVRQVRVRATEIGRRRVLTNFDNALANGARALEVLE